ncbi:MAG: hypothetical protein A2041_11675 [Bacteroidetes bacterium GWA2_31_9b]|nr:MAG: hypothetical protein A2041_11675 [Bacteroidetes bacterium GWA2_31_9b]
MDKNILSKFDYHYLPQDNSTTPPPAPVVYRRDYQVDYLVRGLYCLLEGDYGECREEWEFNKGSMIFSWELKNLANNVSITVDIVFPVSPDNDLDFISESIFYELQYTLNNRVNNNPDFYNLEFYHTGNVMNLKRKDATIKTDMSKFQLIMKSDREYTDPSINYKQLRKWTVEFRFLRDIMDTN